MSPADTVVVASHSSNALFPFLPRWLKAVGFVFFLLHFRSWPTCARPRSLAPSLLPRGTESTDLQTLTRRLRPLQTGIGRSGARPSSATSSAGGEDPQNTSG